MASKTKKRRPLTRERVLATAIRLADKNGIESLSMRKLARELGVEAMSLYNHVANKRDLVDGMVDLVVDEFELPAGDTDWERAVRTYAVSAHEALLRHPWACKPVLTPPDRPSSMLGRLRNMDWLLGRLRNAGFSADLTYHAYHAIDSHIFGFTLWQLGHQVTREDIEDLAATFLRELPIMDYPHAAEHVEQHMAAAPGDGARAFEFGLDLILEGLKRARTD
jgi:AcrR family transcriptional regulator